MSRHTNRYKIVGLILLAIANIIFFGLVNPLSSPTAVLFIAFALLTIDLFCLLYYGVITMKKLLGWPKTSARRLAAVITGGIILLLALQSVGQLTIRDTLAVLLVFAIAYFYLSRYRSQRG